jgi:tetratricopeptide (TPR) repeat protein
LEESIAFLKKSVNLIPPPYANHTGSISALANALITRFDLKGQLSDLEECISLTKKTLALIPLSHPLRSSILNHLATAARKKFGNLGQLSDLELSISLLKEALNLRPPSHPEHSTLLNNLANAFITRFTQMRQVSDLEESIYLYRKALDLSLLTLPLHNDHSGQHSGFLNNLANALLRRFEELHQHADIEESIALNREVLDLQSSLYPNQFRALYHLANALITRFQGMGQLDDLDESISLLRKASGLAFSEKRVVLNTLGNALMERFRQTNQLNDMEESISLNREALDLTPPTHPNRPFVIHNLANVLKGKFFIPQQSQLSDLEEIIALYRGALQMTSPSHPHYYIMLNGLAGTLVGQFQHTGLLSCLQESIHNYRQCISLLPAYHSTFKWIIYNGFGKALAQLHVATGQSSYLSESIDAFKRAVKSEASSALNRFTAAKAWANVADSLHHASALDAYQCAISFLPQLITFDMNLKTRLDTVSKANGLACDAAYCAIQAGQLEQAIMFLSEGRAVFWSQALQLHAPLDKLQSVAPVLAQKLKTISNALERSSHRESRDLSNPNQDVRSLEQEAAFSHSLTEDWNNTINEIRSLSEFQNFLYPKPFSELQKAASNGPIIFLNGSNSGCDGLVLTSSSVIHVPFPNVTTSTLKTLGLMTKAAVSSSGRYVKLSETADSETILKAFVQKQENLDHERHGHKRPVESIHYTSEEVFQAVLDMLWHAVVYPIIQTLNLQV